MLEIKIKYETRIATIEITENKKEMLKYQDSNNIITILYDMQNGNQSILMAQINEIKYWFEDGSIQYLKSGENINEIDKESILKTVNDIIEQVNIKLTIFPKINKIGGEKWN